MNSYRGSCYEFRVAGCELKILKTRIEGYEVRVKDVKTTVGGS
jgi:hypothetical protein